MKKILITGANSFLGHHVITSMNKIGGEFYLLTPRSYELNLMDNIGLSLYLHDYEPDCILHMAALCGGIKANQKRPADFLTDNTLIALNLFIEAKNRNIKQIYTLGSVCAYPKFCPVPFKEDDLWNGYPEETNAPYGMAKRLQLLLSQTYRDQYGFSGAHLVPVNLYGEHDHFDLENSHVIPALIRRFTEATENNTSEVQLWGTGTATREFLYAGDAGDVIAKAVLSNFNYREPINLGTGSDISIKDLAILIAELVGYNGLITYGGQVSDGQPKRRLDVTRAKEVLGWEAKTNLRDGLVKTISWYKESRN